MVSWCGVSVVFYQWLDPTLWEGSALFELWAQELELIYGDLRQRLSPNAKTDAGSLGDRFGFDTPPELPRLLQSIPDLLQCAHQAHRLEHPPGRDSRTCL